MRRSALEALDEQGREKIRKQALGLPEDTRPEVRSFAVQACLAGGWREFLPSAVELLSTGNGEIRAAVSRCLFDNREILSENDIRQLHGELLRTDDPHVYRSLMGIMKYHDSPAATAVLWELVRDDRPRLWCEAVYGLTRRRGALDEHRDLERDLRIKKFIALRQTDKINDPRYASDAHDLLTRMITPQLCYMNLDVFHSVLKTLVKNVDRPTSTAAIIDFLRAVDDPGNWGGMAIGDWRNYQARSGIRDAVTHLNIMHNLNLGGIGRDDVNCDAGGRDWFQNARDGVTWYETGVDPGKIPADYRAGPGDLRIVWCNTEDAERSLIGIWPQRLQAGGSARLYRLESGKDFVAFRIVPQGTRQPARAWSVELQTGEKSRWRTNKHSNVLSAADIPALIFPKNDRDVPNAKERGYTWEIHVERADSPESIISDTKAFKDWWERCGPRDAMEEAVPNGH